jgi:hypothetical protein
VGAAGHQLPVALGDGGQTQLLRGGTGGVVARMGGRREGVAAQSRVVCGGRGGEEAGREYQHMYAGRGGA